MSGKNSDNEDEYIVRQEMEKRRRQIADRRKDLASDEAIRCRDRKSVV